MDDEDHVVGNIIEGGTFINGSDDGLFSAIEIYGMDNVVIRGSNVVGGIEIIESIGSKVEGNFITDISTYRKLKNLNTGLDRDQDDGGN